MSDDFDNVWEKEANKKFQNFLIGWKLTATTKNGNEKNIEYLEILEVKISDFNPYKLLQLII